MKRNVKSKSKSKSKSKRTVKDLLADTRKVSARDEKIIFSVLLIGSSTEFTIN